METTLSRDVNGELISADFAPPFLLRLGSVLIDYIIFLLFPVGGLVSDHLFTGGLGIFVDKTLWLIAVIITLINLQVLPLFMRQTIGMMVTGLRIVKNNGQHASWLAVLVRQTLGYLLTFATGGLGFLWCIFSSRGRALHDYICGTIVIRASLKEVSNKR